MNEMKKNVRRIFWLFFVMFALVIGYLCKFVFIDAADTVASSYNPRLRMIDKNIRKGDILDVNGTVLATSEYTDDGYVRVYPYGEVFAHVVGFTEVSAMGVESIYSIEMQKLHLELLQRFNHILNDTELKGNSLVLTIDKDLQQLCYDSLSGYKGAIVAIEPSTGKVLAMASNPSFNPNQVGENWSALRDHEDSVLVNRASQGLYPPGSIFKVITTAAAMNNMEDWENFTYVCEGEAYFAGSRLRCFNSIVHGQEDIRKAFTLSCNTFFAKIGEIIGGNALGDMAERVLFNQDLAFPLEYRRSSFALAAGDLNQDEESSYTISELIETAIGQGKTVTTPLHMAMLAGAVGNGGVMMEPYVVDSVLDNNGKKLKTTMPEMLDKVFTPEESGYLSQMMTTVVTSGTALAVSTTDIAIAGKTGTAENSSGDDHGWFICFAPADNPQIALAVLYENSGGSNATLPAAKKIINHYIKG